jgi:hypothetical protein
MAVLDEKVQKFAANFRAGEHGRVTIILASDISVHRRDVVSLFSPPRRQDRQGSHSVPIRHRGIHVFSSYRTKANTVRWILVLDESSIKNHLTGPVGTG